MAQYGADVSAGQSVGPGSATDNRVGGEEMMNIEVSERLLDAIRQERRQAVTQVRDMAVVMLDEILRKATELHFPIEFREFISEKRKRLVKTT